MKSNEINATQETATDAQIQAAMLDLHTALPGIIINFDPATRSATVQPAIQRIFLDEKEQGQPSNLPPCVDVPVHFPCGGGFEMTFPVKKGDHCLLIFAERCIDGWYSSGTVSEPDDYRQHDLSDAFAIVGFSPLGHASAVWMNGIELKNEQDYWRMSAGKLETSCVIYAPNVITPTVDLNMHRHSGGTINGQTGTPIP